MRKKWITFTLFLFVLSTMYGCTDNTSPADRNSSDEKNNITLIRTATNYDQTTSERVKELIKKKHEFNEVIAINNDQLIVIAVDPKHHDRFRLKELKKSLKETAESSITSHAVELSTDKKIALELRKLEERLTEQTITKDELDKELDRIKKLSKEQT